MINDQEDGIKILSARGVMFEVYDEPELKSMDRISGSICLTPQASGIYSLRFAVS